MTYVTVINNKKKESIICWLSEAARIVCISRRQMLRWKNDFKVKEFNHFTIYFDSKILRCHRNNNNLRQNNKCR